MALILIQALTHWQVLKLVVAETFELGGLVALVYLVLTIGSLAGLLLRRVWGFYALYGLIPFATIMLSVPFVPLHLAFLPISERWIGLTTLNVAVLVLAAVGHYWFRRTAGHVPSGAA